MKIRLWCCTSDVNSEYSEDFKLEEIGLAEEEIKGMEPEVKLLLDEVAKDFMYDNKEPQCGYEIINEGEKE